MPTLKTIAVELLRDFGITTLTPANSTDNTNIRGPSTGDLQAVCNAINGALEEIWCAVPAEIFQQRYGGVLREPATVSVTVTQYSKTVTITTWADWMTGCTVALTGDSIFNEIASSTALVKPYMGATGTTTGTVYADCIPFVTGALTDSDKIARVLPPIRLAGYGNLRPAGSRVEFLQWSGLLDVTTPHTLPAGTQTSNFNKQTGTPTSYFVDAMNLGNASYTNLLRVNPMPTSAMMVEFNTMIKPPVYVTTDIDNGDHATDPAKNVILPFSLFFLTAFARRRLCGDGRFVNVGAKDEINRQYLKALESLGDLKPSITAAHSMSATPIFRGSMSATPIFRG